MLRKPWTLFLFVALLLAVVSFLPGSDHSVDIHLYDTYYVLSRAIVLRPLALLLIFFWTVYSYTGDRLRWRWLTWVHVAGTCILVGGLALVLAYYDPWVHRGIGKNDTYYAAVQYSVYGILLLQGVYIVNLIVGLVRRRQTR